MDAVKDVLGRWGRTVAEATRKAEDLAGNTWQHCIFFCFLLEFQLLSSSFLIFGASPLGWICFLYEFDCDWVFRVRIDIECLVILDG